MLNCEYGQRKSHKWMKGFFVTPPITVLPRASEVSDPTSFYLESFFPFMIHMVLLMKAILSNVIIFFIYELFYLLYWM